MALNPDFFTHRSAFGSTEALSDLDLVNAGEQACPSGHRFHGMHAQNVIHYVLSGRGSFQMDGRRSVLAKGGLFFCPADTAVDYLADEQNPWRYLWVGFKGAGASRLAGRVPLIQTGGAVQSPPNPHFPAIIRSIIDEFAGRRPGFEMRALSEFYAFLGQLPGRPVEAEKSVNHVDSAVDFLRRHHSEPIDVNDISTALGLERSYLSALYRRTTGETLFQSLENLRLALAKKLLVESPLRISEIAHSCGYEDPAVFMKMFRRRLGSSPGLWRERKSKGGTADFRASDPSPYSAG
ncbi:MAG: AraC family transcriptional regulator [Spirochaetia bacterium]|nr:AraC family transcriptional regulator [Spirochaetia bacterium]